MQGSKDVTVIRPDKESVLVKTPVSHKFEYLSSIVCNYLLWKNKLIGFRMLLFCYLYRLNIFYKFKWDHY